MEELYTTHLPNSIPIGTHIKETEVCLLQTLVYSSSN
jgi:hypothetical protein